MVTGQQIVVDGGFMLGKPPSAAGATPAPVQAPAGQA
jgi:hypothetical protein